MKEVVKESLMDCLIFISDQYRSRKRKGFKIPYYAAQMVNIQMNTMWLFDSPKSIWNDTRREVQDFVVQNKIDSMMLRKKKMRTW